MMVARYRALTPVMTGGQGYGRAVEMMVARYRALTLSEPFPHMRGRLE